MRVLVTGGTGFIGSHTTLALLEAGHEVCLLVRDPAKLERVFGAHGLAVPNHRVGDIGDAASVRGALAGCDAVVHTAALVALHAARAREVLETNPRGVENVLGGALELGLSRMVYVSSLGALFRPNQPLASADVPVVPGEAAYARSKSDSELTVRRLQDQGAPIRTVYPAAVLGPDDPTLSPANQALRTFVRYLAFSTSSGVNRRPNARSTLPTRPASPVQPSMRTSLSSRVSAPTVAAAETRAATEWRGGRRWAMWW